MSTHRIEVVRIGEIHPHPNADKMQITHVWGWQCCIGKDQFKSGDLAIYVPPDYTVPTDRPEFSFLKRDGRDRERISVRRFRQQLSQGLLIKAPDGAVEGQDLMADLGIERYEPPTSFDTTMFEDGPVNIYSPKFDVESYQRYRDLFKDGEPVIATEKLHGANARYVYAMDACGGWKMFCGSRTNWVVEGNNPWRNALANCPQIEAWCKANPQKVLYGEVFGNVQSLKYGCGGKTLFAAFAILDHHSWVSYAAMMDSLMAYEVPTAPMVYCGPFDEKLLGDLAEQDSQWPGANHLSEGVVVVPEIERTDPSVGRVCLKMVSNRYLMS